MIGVASYTKADGIHHQAPLASYGSGGFNDHDGSASDLSIANAPQEGSLEASIPGVPGQDYPIYSEVPETPFTCNGQVEGGNTQFHIHSSLKKDKTLCQAL